MANSGHKRGKGGGSKSKKSLLSDKRFKVIAGIAITVFSVFLLLGMISYLFTWKGDQSFLRDHVFSSPDINVENWSGKSGAYLADLLLNRGFGLASFSIPFILSLIGLCFLNISISKLFRKIIIIAIITIYISVAFGYIFDISNGFLGSGPGGRHGLWASRWLTAFMGKPGTGLFLSIFLFGIIIFTNENALEWFKSSLGKILKISSWTDHINKTDADHKTNPEENNVILSEPDDDLIFETEFPQPESDNKNPVRNSDSNTKTDQQEHDNFEIGIVWL
jgi:S-DNA-T family DNA segregation ATPase FtsK/SpoIIIE